MSACRWCDNAPHAGLCDPCREKADMMADGRPQEIYGTATLVCPHCGRAETGAHDAPVGECLDLECDGCARLFQALTTESGDWATWPAEA